MSNRVLVMASLLLLASACRTVPIPHPTVIEVQPGLSPQNIEVAILAAITNRPPPPDYSPSRSLSDADFERFVWKAFLQRAHTRSWSVEGRKPGQIIAAVTARRHYLELGIHFDSSTITLTLLRSENLQQTETSIHRKVPLWILRLEQRIRRELGRLSFATDAAA